MKYGAGWVAARRFGAAEIVDPRPFAVGSIAATYAKYPGTGPILPAMGYGDALVADLEKTINKADVDMVISATPIDLDPHHQGKQTHAARCATNCRKLAHPHCRICWRRNSRNKEQT